MDKRKWFRRIPKVDVLLETAEIQGMIRHYSRDTVVSAIQKKLDEIREFIKTCEEESQAERKLDRLPAEIEREVAKVHQPNLKPVINGTGTILHTNLGRAPISDRHMERLSAIATGYSNLEYNLEEGKRGERYSHFEKLLCKITGAESAMAVNNNAAAVMLILSSMAKGGEVVVSRGELVEIGGKFRIPDVMEQSGARLVEVGTTNKTHYQDYADAVTEETKAFLKVHTSNYRIVGFTETVEVGELTRLAKEYQLPVIEDLGSGVLIDLSKYGLEYEPTVQDSVRQGADIVCFSGDKLLGGAQAGIIVGKKAYIDQMKKNPLTRALRIDKFTAATLELVLQEYLSEEKAVQRIPVLRMMTARKEEIEKEAKALRRMLRAKKLPAEIFLVDCESQIGGGSLPLERIPSVAVAVRPEKITVAQLEARMRHLPIPVIPRIANNLLLLDVRTIERKWFAGIADQLVQLKVLEEEPEIELGEER